MHAKLVVVEGRAGRREVVLTLPASIGRRAHQTLQILHPTVSREHCELVEQDGQILVRDKKSANGTWIGGKRITESLLRPGDRLTVGPLVFEADYAPGNGAAIEGAPSTKKAGTPTAKKGAGAAAVPPAPATVAADDFEAALAADLMAELGGISADEVQASAAAPTLDGEPLPVGEFDHLADELNDNFVADDLGGLQDELDVELLGGLEVEAVESELPLPELEADELADADFQNLEVDSAELNFEPVAEIAPLELEEPVASDLDLDLDLTSGEPDFADFAAESPDATSAGSTSTAAEPSLDDLLASDEPAAPWDAIGEELDADLALDDEANDVDLALGDLGLEAVELDSLAGDSLEENAAPPAAIEFDSTSTGALDLDELNLESPEIDELELELSDSPEAISDDLVLDAELELPLGDDLPSDVPSAGASAAPPASLDDFFAGLNGGDSGAADEMPAIELDDLKLDAELSEIEFESAGAGPEIAAIDFGPESDDPDSVAGPQLADELNLDVDLEFEDLQLDDSELDDSELALDEPNEIELGDSEAGESELESREFGELASGAEASLRIADLDLDSELGLDRDSAALSFADEAAADLTASADSDELIFDLDADEPEVAIDGTAQELHLFLEDEPLGVVLDESIAPEEPSESARDAALEEPVEAGPVATDPRDLADLPGDVLTVMDMHEPLTSEEAAELGTIFAAASEISADSDSQDLWPVDEGIAATDELALDELSTDSELKSVSDELIAPEWNNTEEAPLEVVDSDADLPAPETDLIATGEVAAAEPADTWNETPAAIPADIPTAPDNVDPFDFLDMEGAAAGAAEIVESFVDDEDTPYDPDSPRQRLNPLAPEIPPSNSEDALLDEGPTAQSIDVAAHDAQSALSESGSDDIFFVDEPVSDVAPEVDLALPLDDSPAAPVVDDAMDSSPLASEVAEAEFTLDDDLLSFDEVEPSPAVDEPIAELPGFDERSTPPAELAAEDNLDDLFAELEADAPVVGEPLSFDELDAASDDRLIDSLPADEPLAHDPPVDDLLVDDLLADNSLAPLDGSQAADETLDVNAESLLTFNETSVEELGLLDAGDDSPGLLAAPADETAPIDESASLDDDLALGELDLAEPVAGELAIGDAGLGDLALGDTELGDLGLGDSELGELDLGEPNLEPELDSAPEIAAASELPVSPAVGEESAEFDFLAAPSAASAAPPQAERIWWPFGDKSATNADSPTDVPPAMPTPRAAATDDLASLADSGSQVEHEALLELGPASAADELTFEDSLLGGSKADDLALDDLTFEDAVPAESEQADLSLDNLSGDEPLALGEPSALADDATAAPDIDLNALSPPEPDTTIAFLDDEEPELLLGGLTSDDSTAELPLATDDDLGLSDPALDSLALSTPSPSPSIADNLPAAAASAIPAAPARKWWKFWEKSGKPSVKAPKPVKPAKAPKKSKAVAENQEVSGLPNSSGTSSTATPSPAADDLLLLGGTGAAAEELLLPDGPELDFEPLSLDEGPEHAASPPAPTVNEENFRTLYAEVVEQTGPAVDDVDDLVFDAPEEETSLASDQAAEPDFSAFDVDDPFGEELIADAPATNAAVDEFAVDEFGSEPPSASADEPEPKLPGEAETVDDNLLDDFFKNF